MFFFCFFIFAVGVRFDICCLANFIIFTICLAEQLHPFYSSFCCTTWSGFVFSWFSFFLFNLFSLSLRECCLSVGYILVFVLWCCELLFFLNLTLFLVQLSCSRDRFMVLWMDHCADTFLAWSSCKNTLLFRVCVCMGVCVCLVGINIHRQFLFTIAIC